MILIDAYYVLMMYIGTSFYEILLYTGHTRGSGNNGSEGKIVLGVLDIPDV